MSQPAYAYGDADREYANGAFIPNAAGLYERWQAKAAAFRQTWAARAELGGAADVFHPAGEAQGTLVFIHGGYWIECSPDDFSHLAAGALTRGWRVVMPRYTLAPKARIAQMVAEVAAVIAPLQGPLVVTGHSAGGHLAARMGNDDLALPAMKVVPISPLSELAPLMATEMNQKLQIDEAEAAAQSPARLPLRENANAHVVVGQQERPAFLWQARTLSEEWHCDWTPIAGADHFSILEGMEEPQSPLMELLLQ